AVAKRGTEAELLSWSGSESFTTALYKYPSPPSINTTREVAGSTVARAPSFVLVRGFRRPAKSPDSFRALVSKDPRFLPFWIPDSFTDGDLLDEVEGFSLADGTCVRKMGFLRWKIRGGI
ncbi:hypothetical protein EJ110_NYTH42458, partial [Nymphaea thermarum]